MDIATFTPAPGTLFRIAGQIAEIVEVGGSVALYPGRHVVAQLADGSRIATLVTPDQELVFA